MMERKIEAILDGRRFHFMGFLKHLIQFANRIQGRDSLTGNGSKLNKFFAISQQGAISKRD
jgi:hypothetical protein